MHRKPCAVISSWPKPSRAEREEDDPLVVRVLQKFQSEYTMDFNNDGWKYLLHAIGVRNRLAHPKRPQDLEVSQLDAVASEAAFLWFTAFVMFVLEVHKARWSDVEREISKRPEVPSFFRLLKTEAPEAAQEQR
jgi:hypothetical protein